ncbi:hypothetical protein C8B47_15630 [filamentous cyanobacterium CCP4]|nr:hypothetical protein C8B47_15630 [filamentous cyanobacterium CCP4]
MVAPTSAQNRSATPYCFAVKDSLSVFARPANNAATGDRFNRGDIAYATANPPTTRFDGNRAFVEVAIYGGRKAWIPRLSTIDGVPLIVDLSTDQCTNPPAHAAGGSATGGPSGSVPYCYAVVRETAVFSRPNTGAATGDRFAVGDIAYAITNPPTAVVQGGRSFIEVAIYGGNKAWVPQRSTVDGVPILMDLSTDQCTNPPAHAAGGRQ